MAWGKFAARGGEPIADFHDYLLDEINKIPNDVAAVVERQTREPGRVDLVAAGVVLPLVHGARESQIAIGTITTPGSGSGVFVESLTMGWQPNQALYIPHGQARAFDRSGYEPHGFETEIRLALHLLSVGIERAHFSTETTAQYVEWLSQPDSRLGVALPEL